MRTDFEIFKCPYCKWTSIIKEPYLSRHIAKEYPEKKRFESE